MTETLRTLRWSTWLGWQIESNWADVRLFLLYLVIKPVCGSLLLVCMFYAAKYGLEATNPGKLGSGRRNSAASSELASTPR